MRSSRTRTVTVNAVIAARPDSKSDDIRQTIKKTALITAVKTPYLENGKIDMSAYDNLIQIQIANGCEGVIVGGTTGMSGEQTVYTLFPICIVLEDYY